MADRMNARAQCSVALLAAASGAVDALALTVLGQVFAGVMTGNLVLMGVTAGAGGEQGLPAALALAGYATGTALAARYCRSGGGGGGGGDGAGESGAGGDSAGGSGGDSAGEGGDRHGAGGARRVRSSGGDSARGERAGAGTRGSHSAHGAKGGARGTAPAPGTGWPPRVVHCLMLETVLLAAFAAAAAGLDGRPEGGWRTVLLVAAAFAMGAQSAAMLAGGTLAAPSTYFTGTLTALFAQLPAGGRAPGGWAAVRLVAVTCGAAGAVALRSTVPQSAFGVPAVLVAGALLLQLGGERAARE
ncbi:DUF1275 family protein [Streptomyces albus]|uniref:DUF1275 family protein n=1 Tax=Streptomyces TaxID=1883 RepID=UPI0024E0B427|nr:MULTISPECIES: DUF1275 family protein [Streptomyces]